MFLAFGLPFLLGYGVLPLTTFINEVASLVGFGVMLVVASMEPIRVRWHWRYGTLMAALGLLLVVTCLQALRSTTPGSGELYATTCGYLLVAALAYHLGWRSGQAPVDRDHWIDAFCAAVAPAALVAAIAGLIQYFNVSIDGALIPRLVTAGRAYGFVRQPNHQASFLVVGLLALGQLVSSGRLRREWGVAGGVLIALGILASGSRMGLLMLALSLLWMAMTFGAQARTMTGVVAVTIPCFVAILWWMHVKGMVPFYGVAKVQQSLDEGAGVRTQVWLETAKLIARSPWTGIGLHHFGQMYFLTDAAINTHTVMTHSHNLLLQLAADFGLPVASIAIVALGGNLACARLVWREPRRAFSLAVVAAIGIHSLLEFPLWYVQFLAMAMYMLGVSASVSAPALPLAVQETSSTTTALGRPRKGLGQVWLAGWGALILVMAVWINHDYYKISQLFFGVQMTPGGETVTKADHLAWWGRYARYAQLASRPVTADNATAYWSGMQNAACLTIDPLYMPSLAVALAYQGRVQEAKRLLYIHWRLSSDGASQARALLAQHRGQVFDDLKAYLDRPMPVEVEPQAILPCLR